MSDPGPLSTPLPWDLVADGYVEENVPVFKRFAADALVLAGFHEGDRLLDVATGPGTLALLAAGLASEVVAIDFSPAMLARLRARLGALANVEVRQGDGQALDLPDRAFDVAASMFGLMFFPDRAAGLAELHRVLRPGGRAVVSSWQPFDRSPVMATFFQVLGEVVPMPGGGRGTPMSSPEDCLAELEAAGFVEVGVHGITHLRTFDDVDAFWASNRRGMAPVLLLQRALGEAGFAAAEARILDALRTRLGPGPVEVPLAAWITVGTREV